MSRYVQVVSLAAGLANCAAPVALADVTFEWATIGNADNVADPSTGFGAVAYVYRMATTEVTNAQYTEFLNNVAITDDFGGSDPHLYSTDMALDDGGITRAGSSESFSYNVVVGRGNNPVSYVSFFDAMPFTNWLSNGQGSGDTETGVYDIANGLTETRAADAQFYLPSENE